MFGDIVLSKAGRDKDLLFFVLKVEENYVCLVDGDVHKVENPKRKKIKHIEKTDFYSEKMATKLKNGRRLTNQDVKKVLKGFLK